MSEPITVQGGGWWPPGDGEPGEGWQFEPSDLRLAYDDLPDVLDVLLPTPSGDRALCSIPLTGIALALATALAEGSAR